MEQKGKLVVISGFSGAGKGTLMKALLAAHPDRYALSVSATTRDPRPGEKDGVDYFFVTDETFDSMIQKDDFLEYAKYVSHSYGTPRSYVEENLNLGKNVILEIAGVAAIVIGNDRLGFFVRFFQTLRVALFRFIQAAEDQVVEINFHKLPIVAGFESASSIGHNRLRR